MSGGGREEEASVEKGERGGRVVNLDKAAESRALFFRLWIAQVIAQAASERRGHRLKGFRNFYQKAKARIWHVCRVYS